MSYTYPRPTCSRTYVNVDLPVSMFEDDPVIETEPEINPGVVKDEPQEVLLSLDSVPAFTVVAPVFKGYQPTERYGHCMVRTRDRIYLWSGLQTELPSIHTSAKKTHLTSRIEVFDLQSGRWEQKRTTGTPPLGVVDYAAVAIGDMIFYFGGDCHHLGECCHNSLCCLDVNTLNWKELSRSGEKSGYPSMKRGCHMLAVRFDGEPYLVVIGGEKRDNMTHYSGGMCSDRERSFQTSHEVHYFRLFTCQWISPKVTGDQPPLCCSFTLTSLTNNRAILFGGDTPDGVTNHVYFVDFKNSSVKWTKLINDDQSINWPKERWGHSSVLIDNTHLLVLGGWNTNNCWLLNINRRVWTELQTLPDTVTVRYRHSLSVWRVTPATVWIIEFGGIGRDGMGLLLNDTAVIELICTGDDQWCISTVPPDQYTQLLAKRKSEWLESHPGSHFNEEKDEKDEEDYEMAHLLRERFYNRHQRLLEEKLQEKRYQLQEYGKKLVDLQHLVRNKQKQFDEIFGQSQERICYLEEELQSKARQIQQLEQCVYEGQERERILHETHDTQSQERIRYLEELQSKTRQIQQFEQHVYEGQERERILHETCNTLEERIQQQESSWVVRGNEIDVSPQVIGKGGWGEVRVANFRGLRVAAKCLHDVILSPYNISVFVREMEIASKIRHPNLLQFIGATREGNPIILSELMPTSLRKELETGSPLPYHAVLNISLDVACALNYLHLFRPHPILHRDVSSANVLLHHVRNSWRAKVSDYGSANLQNLVSRTSNPGSPVYSSPESPYPRLHSPAMDVYSYGVLLVEMMTCCIPVPDKRSAHVSSIRQLSFKSLVERCLKEDIRTRPTMAAIIRDLNLM